MEDRRRFRVALFGVTVLALVLRLLYLFQIHGSPLLSLLMGDARQYDEWAWRIAGGDWIGTGAFYQAPLYPYFLAVIYKLGGHDAGVVRLVQAGLGALACALLGLAGRRFFDGRTGILAGLLLAIYPTAIFFDGLIQKSSLDLFLVALILLLIALVRDRQSRGRIAALGLAVSLLALNRENARVIYPVVIAWLLFGFRSAPVRRRAEWTAAFVAAALAVLLPVGYRNYRVGGAFLISTSQFGPNFYIGNHAGASGSYEALVPGRGDPVYERDDATRLASAASGRALSPAEVSDYWSGQAFSFIRSQPRQWLALVGKKIALTFNAAEITDTESIEAYATYSWLLRGLLWLDFGVVLALAALGCWARRRDWRQLLVVYGVFAALALSVAAFYVVSRYRHPLVPLVLVLAAAGLAPLLSIRLSTAAQLAPPGVRVRRWLPGVAAAALVAIATHVPMKVVQDVTWMNLGSLLVQAGRSTDAIPVLQRAVAVDPAYALPHFHLGLAYREAGQPQMAMDELTAAIRLRPDYADAHNALGVTLRGLGRKPEALERFREAARLAPDSVEAHSNLGLSLMEAGQFEEAVREHRRAVALAPDTPTPHNNLAMALLREGEAQQAISEYRTALALRPDYGEAHANLAFALALLRDYEGAFPHFAEASRLLPGNPDIRIAFGNALAEAGRIDDAIDQYHEAARLSPNSIEPLLLAARALVRAGRFPEALADLETARGIATATGQEAAGRDLDGAIRQTQALMK